MQFRICTPVLQTLDHAHICVPWGEGSILFDMEILQYQLKIGRNGTHIPTNFEQTGFAFRAMRQKDLDRMNMKFLEKIFVLIYHI